MRLVACRSCALIPLDRAPGLFHAGAISLPPICTISASFPGHSARISSLRNHSAPVSHSATYPVRSISGSPIHYSRLCRGPILAHKSLAALSLLLHLSHSLSSLSTLPNRHLSSLRQSGRLSQHLPNWKHTNQRSLAAQT